MGQHPLKLSLVLLFFWVAKHNQAWSQPTPPAADSNSTATPDNDLRILTWNLEWFYDDEPGDNFSPLAKQQSAPSRTAWNWKRDAVAGAIASANPHIAGFQEIEGRRVLWYLTRALLRNHSVSFRELALEGTDIFTEQDVGFIYRPQAEPLTLQPLAQTFFGRSAAMKASDRYGDVSKHLAVEFEVKLGDAVERVTMMNVHLRAKPEASAIRTNQARTVHAWLADKIAAGENVMVVGDFNTEIDAIPAPLTTDMSVATGQETATELDDLIDLHQFLAESERQTHLIPKKSFDRILISRSMLEDDPNRVDLAFEKMVRLKDLSVRGEVDPIEQHFNEYWQLDDASRDISDHWPIMAIFRLQ